MKEVINIYKNNKLTIENYIHAMIADMPPDYIKSADRILKKYSFIQLIYEVDKEYRQISPTVSRKERNSESEGSDKSHYFVKLKLDEKGIYVSNPYIHYRTGKPSVSVVVAEKDRYKILDINLIKLLEHMRMIEYNTLYERYKKAIYSVGSAFLSIVSIMLIVYGGYIFSAILYGAANTDFLQNIFKSIISITLGLAIFDLAKQIFEHEVLFQPFQHSEAKQYKILGKFLISIIIAMSIETLMVVFKIALSDYTKMLAAFYLMIGTTLMLAGLGYFYKIIKQNDTDEE